MLEALAAGAEPNWRNLDEDGKTPLIMAVKTVHERKQKIANCFDHIVVAPISKDHLIHQSVVVLLERWSLTEVASSI